MLRLSLGVTRTDKISNEYIRRTAHVGRVGEKHERQDGGCFGHIRRKDDGCIGEGC